MAELSGCIQLLFWLLSTILTRWWGHPGHVAMGSASADLGNPLAGLLQGKGALSAIGCCLAVALLLKLGRGSPPLGLSEASALLLASLRQLPNPSGITGPLAKLTCRWFATQKRFLATALAGNINATNHGPGGRRGPPRFPAHKPFLGQSQLPGLFFPLIWVCFGLPLLALGLGCKCSKAPLCYSRGCHSDSP